MRKLKLLAYSLIFIVTMLACGAPMALQALVEKGEISFVSPVSKSTYHDDNTGSLLPVPVTLQSSFDVPKEARVSDGKNVWTCTLAANEQTPCPSAQLQGPGVYTLHAEVFKVDGETVVATETTFTWAPYSRLDKGIAWITGNSGGDPSGGYLLVGFIAACLASVTLSIKGGKWGAIVGFFLPLIGLAYVSYQTGSAVISLAILQGVFGTLGAGLVVVVILAWLNSDKAISGPQWVSTKGFDARGLPYERQVMNAGFIGPAAQSPQTAQIARALIGAGEEPLTPIEMQALLESGLGSQLQIEASDIPLQVPKKKTSLFRFH